MLQCHTLQFGSFSGFESVSLSALRSIEDTLQSGKVSNLRATTPVDVAIYILNHKRLYLKDIEARYGISVTIAASDTLQGANFTIEQGEAINEMSSDSSSAVKMDWTLQKDEISQASQSGDEGSEEGRMIISKNFFEDLILLDDPTRGI